MTRHEQEGFPSYSTPEKLADGIIHVIGVVAGILATVWMLTSAAGSSVAGSVASLSVYCIGLLAMLSASAAYNMAPPGRAKGILRRVDHAVIFLMIAGTYTPFTMHLIEGWQGVALGIAIWIVACVGIALKLFFPRRLERLSLALYLAMGWMLVIVIGPIIDSLEPDTLALLLAGGILYTIGAGIHALRRLPFHNAIWHALVLVAAGLHYASIYGAFAT